MRIFLTVAVWVIGLDIESSVAQSDADLTSMVRVELESGFRQHTGLGFKSFRCDFGAASRLPPEFECEAVDDEDDRFFYRIWEGNDRLDGSIEVWQPVGQLYPEGVAWLRGPIDAFLDALEEDDPQPLIETLSPALARSIPVAATWSELEALRSGIGAIRERSPVLHSNVSADVHAVEYRIVGEQAALVGRFRIEGSADEEPEITAFLLTPVAGSPMHLSQLEATASRSLAPFFGQPIQEVRIPLDALSRTGDAVEGEVALSDGSTIAVRTEQSAPSTDFDRNDYRFQILEASWLVARHLAGGGDADARVSCPERTVTDGGSLICTAEGANGIERFELRRRGGEHRLLALED